MFQSQVVLIFEYCDYWKLQFLIGAMDSGNFEIIHPCEQGLRWASGSVPNARNSVTGPYPSRSCRFRFQVGVHIRNVFHRRKWRTYALPSYSEKGRFISSRIIIRTRFRVTPLWHFNFDYGTPFFVTGTYGRSLLKNIIIFFGLLTITMTRIRDWNGSNKEEE